MKRGVNFFILSIILLVVTLLSWQSVTASEKIFVPTDGTKTIKLGKQGLFLSNLPTNVRFAEIEKLTPPLRAIYTLGIDIAYRGPVLDISFIDAKLKPVSPTPTLTSVYFNLSEPEVEMWKEGGESKIAIWYFNKNSEEWQLCPPRLIPEKLDNGKYDRLACFVMGNGLYLLGKMELDPVFPLWFKPHDPDKETEKEISIVVQGYSYPNFKSLHLYK